MRSFEPSLSVIARLVAVVAVAVLVLLAGSAHVAHADHDAGPACVACQLGQSCAPAATQPDVTPAPTRPLTRETSDIHVATAPTPVGLPSPRAPPAVC
ncbi:MAG: hypothetical protein NZ898_09815 [Myxococcota bacterium]|nr:hypothetical protein [Myxococcota bacterium]MDW8363539.1 hypothetical protein [Myxococcales bacterium]